MAKKPATTRKPRAAKPTSVEVYAASTVIPGEAQTGRWSRNTDISVEEQARRFTQWVQIYGSRNASDCATQTLRWYTDGKNGSVMKRLGFSVKSVTDRRRLTYLKDSRRVGKSGIYADKSGDVYEILEHPIIDMLHCPNPWQDHTAFMYTMYLCKEFAGNLYQVPIKPEYEGGLFQLRNLMPQYVRVIPNQKTFIGGYTYGRNRADVETYGPNDLWHQKFRENPWNPYYGLAPIQSLMTEADIDAASAIRDLAMMNNGARIDGLALMPPDSGSNQTQFNQVAEMLNRDHQGPQNAGRIKVTNAIDFKPISWPSRDMEWQLRIANYERRVAFAFDFPDTMSKLNDASRANGETGNEQRARFGIEPRLRSTAEFMNRCYTPLYGINEGEMWCAYDNCVPQDDKAIADIQVSLYGAGLRTLNECRSELGDDPMPDGDELKELPDPNPPETMNEPPQKDKAVGTREGVSQGWTAGPHNHKAVDELPGIPNQADSVFARLEKAVAAWVVQVAGRITEQNIQTLIESPEVRGEFSAIVEPYIRRLFAIGLSAGLEQVPTAPLDALSDPYSVIPERGAQWLKGYTMRLSGEVTQTMQEQVSQAISDGMVQGRTMGEITVEVATGLKDGSGVRAERIARTETSRAVQNGELEAWKAMGVERWKWELSANACPLCVALSEKANDTGGTVVGKSVAGVGELIELPDGKTHTVTYADIDTALGHPNCRCRMIAVLDPVGETP